MPSQRKRHEPTKTYDFQLQKFAFSSGQSDWADGDIHGNKLARFKDTHQRVIGVLVQCPVAGRIGIKDGNNNYLLNRIHKDYLQYNIEIPLEERFYPIHIDNIKNLQFGVEFKPIAALGADTYIDIVFLLEKDLPHLKGLNGSKDLLTYTIKHPAINIDGKESEYYDKNGEFHMTQKRVPSGEIQGTVFYNIHGELEFKGKKYYLFSHYLMPHVCMFEDEAHYKLVGYQEWKKNDLQLNVLHLTKIPEIMLEPHTIKEIEKTIRDNKYPCFKLYVKAAASYDNFKLIKTHVPEALANVSDKEQSTDTTEKNKKVKPPVPDEMIDETVAVLA